MIAAKSGAHRRKTRERLIAKVSSESRRSERIASRAHYRPRDGEREIKTLPIPSVAVRRICGSLVIGGFGGTALPMGFEARLRAGELGGAILFARNVTPDSAQVAALCEAIARTNEDLPPIVSVDQEGGRVARIKHEVVRLPPAIALGSLDDAMIERAGAVLGAQLAALGFSMDYAPVLDVHTNPQNPVIGDRAFATTPERAAAAAIAFARGLASSGVAPCGKHFPGHGDTLTDSHLELPRVAHDRARLDAIELAPFRAAAKALPAFMSAHVVYDALDARPATLSKRIATALLRDELGFRGVLISDDLEMKAVSKTYGAGEAAVLAIEAGCDSLLVCSDEDAQVAAVDALTARAERDTAFRARCEEASARMSDLRRAFPPKSPRPLPKTPDDLAQALARLT
jgi:beta-N-acetylhexosaminidase